MNTAHMHATVFCTNALLLNQASSAEELLDQKHSDVGMTLDSS